MTEIADSAMGQCGGLKTKKRVLFFNSLPLNIFRK